MTPDICETCPLKDQDAVCSRLNCPLHVADEISESGRLSWLASDAVMWVFGLTWLGLTVMDWTTDAISLTAGFNEAWMILVGGLYTNRYRDKGVKDGSRKRERLA